MGKNIKINKYLHKDIWDQWIGKSVSKHSRKPFKSGNHQEIVKDISINPHSNKKAFVFNDETFVDCYQCELNMINISEVSTETILREDGSVYKVVDYIGYLKLQLEIIRGEVIEQLYYKNLYGGVNEIDRYGNSLHIAFKESDILLREIIKEQMIKRKADYIIEERDLRIDKILK